VSCKKSKKTGCKVGRSSFFIFLTFTLVLSQKALPVTGLMFFPLPSVCPIPLNSLVSGPWNPINTPGNGSNIDITNYITFLQNNRLIAQWYGASSVSYVINGLYTTLSGPGFACGTSAIDVNCPVNRIPVSQGQLVALQVEVPICTLIGYLTIFDSCGSIVQEFPLTNFNLSDGCSFGCVFC
jgi:hypothetical protein